MGSLGTGEILVIVLVALIVFGPHRLPEITRKAGEWLGKAREMTRAVTDTIDAEYGEITKPIKDLKGEYDATMGDVKGIASSVTDMSFDLAEPERQTEDGPIGTPDKASPDDDDEASTSGEESS
ncbi:MAG: twin-arginine translocase TatA/TatE family subunit [Acidimicrobiia bacterium]